MILNEAIIYDEVLATPYLTRWSTTDRLGLVFSDGVFFGFHIGAIWGFHCWTGMECIDCMMISVLMSLITYLHFESQKRVIGVVGLTEQQELFPAILD